MALHTVPSTIAIEAIALEDTTFVTTFGRSWERLAQSIDWTSTFILPLPSDMARSYDVQVNGMPGVILEETPGSDGYRRRKILLWERDGIVYAINATNMTAPTLLQIAESLQ